MSILEYRANIERLLREQRDDVVLNSSPEHAAVITERLFANGQQHMRILAERLDERIFGAPETLEGAAVFLSDSARRVDMVVERETDAEVRAHPFIAKFADKLGKNLFVRRLKPRYADLVDINFTVMDDRAFRFEADKREVVATAQFARVPFITDLKDLFATVWGLSDPVEPLEGTVAA